MQNRKENTGDHVPPSETTGLKMFSVPNQRMGC